MTNPNEKSWFQQRMDQMTKLPKNAYYLRFDISHYFPFWKDDPDRRIGGLAAKYNTANKETKEN